jgi:hypothetical protein
MPNNFYKKIGLTDSPRIELMNAYEPYINEKNWASNARGAIDRRSAVGAR